MLRQALTLHNNLQRRCQWQENIEAKTINAWLAVELPRNHPDLLPSGMRDPRVHIGPEGITLACRVDRGWIHGVVSLQVSAFVESADVIGLRVAHHPLGRGPLVAQAGAGRHLRRRPAVRRPRSVAANRRRPGGPANAHTSQWRSQANRPRRYDQPRRGQTTRRRHDGNNQVAVRRGVTQTPQVPYLPQLALDRNLAFTIDSLTWNVRSNSMPEVAPSGYAAHGWRRGMFRRRPDLSWPLIALLLGVFFLSLRMPRQWERIARDSTLTLKRPSALRTTVGTGSPTSVAAESPDKAQYRAVEPAVAVGNNVNANAGDVSKASTEVAAISTPSSQPVEETPVIVEQPIGLEAAVANARAIESGPRLRHAVAADGT